MADNKGFYDVYNYGDDLKPADRLKIEHSVYINDENTDISKLTPLSLERLQTMREESAAAEQTIFESLRSATGEWEAQAAQTRLLDKAIEYVRTPPIKHTANKWEADEHNRHTISNTVYRMTYHVYENTRYDSATQKSKPYAWDLTWNVHTNNPDGYRGAKIAGQERKRYGSKSDMEKYLNGRIKAYAHLFTEILPPIPPEYAQHFRVNGQLLPGYTVQGDEPKPPEPAADVAVGGVPVSGQINTGKERDPMTLPLSIQLVTRESFVTRVAGGVQGEWLKLPASPEQLQTALARIGAAGGEHRKDYFINGIETALPVFERVSLEALQKAGIDELNYLAAQIEAMTPKEITAMNAAVSIMSDTDDVHRLVEYTQNTDFFVHVPDVFNEKQLGEYYIEKSGLVLMPDEWKDAVDAHKLGELATVHDKGVFTEHGYVMPTGDAWKPVTEIPQGYRITPEIDYDAIAAPSVSAPSAQTAAAVIPLVLNSENPRERMKEITDKLEAGIKGIFDSEKYKAYLQTLSKFHNYSLNNCLLITMRKPDASHVAGFNAWKDDFKRQVKKGEKGIKILAPAPFKTKKMVDMTDAGGKPVFDENGRRKKEEREITVPAFKITTVFDVSQTEGEPLPELGANELTGSVERYKDVFAAIEKASPVPVAFEAIGTGAKGYYHQVDKRIAVNEGMSELQNLKTLIHEIAHAKLHAINTEKPLKGQDIPDRRTREVEAESIAYTVCQHYGLDTSDYSFGYVAD